MTIRGVRQFTKTRRTLFYIGFFHAERVKFFVNSTCPSTVLQPRSIPAAHRERLAGAAQVDFERVVERPLHALDEFDVDDRGAVNAGESLFRQSLFPRAQRFQVERLFSAHCEDFAVNIGGANSLLPTRRERARSFSLCYPQDRFHLVMDVIDCKPNLERVGVYVK
jgi:hypothetical protein